MYSQIDTKKIYVSSRTYIYLFIGTFLIFLIMAIVSFAGYYVKPILGQFISNQDTIDIIKGCIISAGTLITVIFAAFFHFKNWYGKVGKCASITVSIAFGIGIGIVCFFNWESLVLPFSFLIVAFTSGIIIPIILFMPGRYLIVTIIGSVVGVGLSCLSFVIYPGEEQKTNQLIPIILNGVVFVGITLISLIMYCRDKEQYNTRYYGGAYVVYIITFPATFVIFGLLYLILLAILKDGIEKKFK